MTPQDQQQQNIQSVGGDTVREQDKVQLILAYLGILSLIPMLTVKDSEFVKWHAKQGLVLFIVFLLIGQRTDDALFLQVKEAQPSVLERYTEVSGIPHNGERVVVLSHGFWRRRFGGDPQTIGRTISLSGDPYVVVGILAADFGAFRASVRELLDAGARTFHVDVMDGHFVPVITFGPGP